jgi:hypothetical protein
MQAYKTEATVEEDGSLTLRSLPFGAGERVEIIVLSQSPSKNASNAYPLRGTAYRYDDPFESVAEADWEAAR